MEDAKSYQTSRGIFNDDPAVLMGLPPLGKVSEFWKRYDHQADIHDKKMTSNLSENLDVLLIFAALFSAINTAFISLTMPNLSSDPLTETNALLRLLVMRADNSTLVPTDLSPPFAPSSNSVIVNGLLYASLSCSLLAAVGAMMAKEWLQSFDRTGQTGPLEEQGRFRQRKFNGVQRWHLEPTVQFLPNLLLLSVILFFAGVYLFLLPINRAVAGVVIAFSGGGAVFCGAAIVAGASSPLCPYQSAASRALKCTMLLFSSRWWRDLFRATVDVLVRRPSKLVRKILNANNNYPSIASVIVESVPTKHPPTTLGEAEISEQVIIAQAAGWLLRATSNRGDQITAAQFVLALDSTACVLAFQDSETRRALIFATQEAFDTWHSQPTERNQEIAELFGLSLCHVLLQPSGNTVKRKDIADLLLHQSSGFGGSFLQASVFAMTKYSCSKPEDKERIFHIAFLFAIITRGLTILDYQWPRMSRVCLTGCTDRLADVLLGLWAILFQNLDPGQSHQSYATEDLADKLDNKIVLLQQLSDAVISGARVLPTVRGNLQSDLLAVRGYTACLQRAAELSNESSCDNRAKMIDGVAGLILSYLDPLTSSNPGETRLELIRLSHEAVLALRSLIHENPRQDETSVSRDARAGQLRSDHLINAAIHIMTGDFKSLTASELLPRIQPQALDQTLALVWGWKKLPVPVQLQLRVWVLDQERLKVRMTFPMSWLQWVEVREVIHDEGVWERVARTVIRNVALQVKSTLRLQLMPQLAQSLMRELGELGQELDQELDRELELRLVPKLARKLAWDLGKVVPKRERKWELEIVPELGQVLRQVLTRSQILTKGLAQRLQVESSILRTLLWVWEKTSSTELDRSDKHKVFVSSCRLWAPLERRVDLIINGIMPGIGGEKLTFDDCNQDQFLTPEDLSNIVKFVEYLQKTCEKSEFIARNADVGINRLFVHLNRRIDWDYVLYNTPEQCSLCCRAVVIENGMI